MLRLALAALVAFGVDQGSKYYVLEVLNLAEVGRIDVAPPYLRFAMAWNHGINFGLFGSGAETGRWLLTAIAVAISAAVFWWARGRDDRWFNVGAGLVVGGAFGNALDRVVHGAVVDFLNMSCCGVANPYSFNLADVFIFAGAGLLILRGGEPAKS